MLNIGFIGVTQKTFKSKKEEIFKESLESLKSLTDKVPFNLIYNESLIEDPSFLENLIKDWEDKMDLLIVQTTTFSSGNIGEIIAKNNIPVIYWALPEPEIDNNLKWNSLCALHFFVSLLKKFNPSKKFKWIYTFPKNTSELLRELKIFKIVKSLRNLRIGHIVGTAPGFLNLDISPNLLREKIGTEIIKFPSLDPLIEIIENLDKDEVKREKENFIGKIDIKIEEKWLEEGIKITLALRKLAEKHKLEAIASRCWPDFREKLSIFPCFSFALINEEIPVSCEGDILSSIAMFMLREISQNPTTVLDLVYYDERGIVLWHCGNTPPSLTKPPISLDYQFNHPGMGSTIDSKFKEGEVTLFSFNQDLKNALIFSGRISYPFETKFKGSFAYITDLPIKPRELFDTILKEGFPHHLVFSYGNFVDLVKEVLYWLEIPSITF